MYPLPFYRAELRRTKGLAGAAPVTTPLRPKPIRLWWSRTDLHRTAGYTAFIALGGVSLFYAWRAFLSRRGQRAQEDFSRQLMQAQEADRQRIAAELHDSLGQNLTIINNRARIAIRDGAGSAADQLEEISRVASQCAPSPTTCAHTNWIASASPRLSRPPHVTWLKPGDHALRPADEIHFYRVVQESLSNVARHSMAATVRLSIRRDNGTLHFEVDDDGRGFNPRIARSPQGRGGNGLAGMAQRVKLMGGTFRCDSAPGRGTRLRVAIPVAAAKLTVSTSPAPGDNPSGSVA